MYRLTIHTGEIDEPVVEFARIYPAINPNMLEQTYSLSGIQSSSFANMNAISEGKLFDATLDDGKDEFSLLRCSFNGYNRFYPTESPFFIGMVDE